MSNFATLVGEVTEDGYANNIPDKADDLKVSEIPLKQRQEGLETLCKVKSKIKKLECNLISGKDCDKVRSSLNSIRRLIDSNKIQVSCEICDNNTNGYRNICKSCLNIPRGIANDLMTIRNTNLRLEFLEHQLSCSLSNQLDRKELISVINEVNAFSKI